MYIPQPNSRSTLWGRRGKLLLIPAGVIAFVLLLSWVNSPTPEGGNRLYSRYALQQSYQQYTDASSEYKIAVISDMDTASRIGEDMKWKGILKFGKLIRTAGKYSVEWTNEKELVSKYNEEGRGMELSELLHFNGQLLSCDDRSGIVYELTPSGLVIPRHVMVSGDGKTTDKGLKCEWMTTKDGEIWAGSIGKEWTKGGKVINYDPMWVKSISDSGKLSHHDWKNVYLKLRDDTGNPFPGYIIHEAVNWMPSLKKWLFLPRKMSPEPYDDVLDEKRGNNKGFLLSEDFSKLETITIGPQDPELGFSSFKYVPFRENEIVVLKTKEIGAENKTETYIMVADIKTGEVLMPLTLLSSSIKFEGIEFV